MMERKPDLKRAFDALDQCAKENDALQQHVKESFEALQQRVRESKDPTMSAWESLVGGRRLRLSDILRNRSEGILRRAAARAQAQRSLELTSGWMPEGMLPPYDDAKPYVFRGLPLVFPLNGFPSLSVSAPSRKETKRGRPSKTDAQREAYRIVGKNIERLMQGKEWTQEHLADRIGVDLSTVKRHINGDVSQQTHVDAYCRELGCSREELTAENTEEK